MTLGDSRMNRREHDTRSEENGDSSMDQSDESEGSYYDGEEEEEDYFLQRLSEQARRRSRCSNMNEDMDDESYDGENAIYSDADNEDLERNSFLHEGELDPVNFLRRLIQARARTANHDNSNTEYTDEGSTPNIFLANRNSRPELHHLNRSEESDDDNDNGRPPSRDFADVFTRIIRDGTLFVGQDRESSEMLRLIGSLNQREDITLILESLNELSERLLMMNGITAEKLIPAGKLARSLVDIMQDPLLIEEFEVNLVACRCLYNFLEVNQDFIHEALNCNAIECLCGKLLEVACIDLTEQALQTLEMISRDPISHNLIIAANGLKACLQYLDFLTVHAQRKCLSIVANSCTNASPNNIEMVKNVFGDIFAVAKCHHDCVVVENCWLAISRVVMCFKLRPDYLKELFLDKVSIMKEMTEVIYVSYVKSLTSYDYNEPSKIALNYSSCLSLLNSLIILSSVSVEISRVLIEECSIGNVITMTLMKLSKPEATPSTKAETLHSCYTQNLSDTAIETFMTAPKDFVSHFLDFVGYLLPIAYNMNQSPFLDDSFEDHPERVKINCDKLTLYKVDIPNSFLLFVSDIWHLLINGYQATVEYNLRKKFLINIFRILSFYDQGGLKKINGIKQITSLLIIIVNQGKAFISKASAKGLNEETDVVNDSSTEQSRVSFKDDSNTLRNKTLLLGSFSIIQSLMEKAPTLFIEEFVKEGLISDVMEIFNCLRAFGSSKRREKLAPRSNQFPSYRINKYVDFELSSFSDCCLSEEWVTCNLLKFANSIKELSSKLSNNGKVEAGKDSKAELEKIRLLLSDIELTRSLTLGSWIKVWERLRKVLLCTGDKAHISSFELASSGILECLTNTLQFESFEFGSQLQHCHEAFLLVFFVNNIGESSGLPPINIFIERLQEILNRSEFFEIISSGGNIQGYGNGNTSAMARQVKLKLAPVGDIKRQFQTKETILSVHAIATFKSIEAFIKHKARFLDINRAFQELDDVDNEESSDVPMEFLNNGEIIPLETTVYGAIYRSLQDRDDETVKPNVIFSNVHEIQFRSTERKKGLHDVQDKKQTMLEMEDNDLSFCDAKTLNILRLLKILFDLNYLASDTLKNTREISNDCFINLKMTVKLNRQLEDLLVVASGTLPGWCIQIPKHFPFIFPMDTRLFLLQSTSFGYSRLIHHWQMRNNQSHDEMSTNGEGQSLGRPTRHKVRISRTLILQSAVKVLSLYGSSPGILEVEYFDEVGSGLGPTLEFYASVSKEFTRKKIKLWRDYDSDCHKEQGYISASTGCFPLPLDRNQIHSENGRKVLFFFNSLGKFVARAMLDSRILDFNFNPVFLTLIQIFNRQKCYKLFKRNLKKTASISTLKLVDPGLAKSLEHLMKYADQFPSTCEEQRPYIKVDGSTLEELCLYFVLPGYPEYELVSEGQNIQINHQNLLFYIHSVIDATLYSGVIHQIKCFMEGFSTVFPINTLLLFSPDELVELFGNAEEDWSIDILRSSVNTNHGYTKDSSSLKQLISIFLEFDHHQRRSLLQFITGSPRLPPGGFKALRPPFTVVRKLPENGLKDDDYLPSVMSCANYLKLPKYSSRETMRNRILQAISEGRGSFLLS